MPHSPSTDATAESPDSPKSPSPASIPRNSLFLPPRGPAATLPPPSPSPSSSTSDAPSKSLPPEDSGAAPTWSAGFEDAAATNAPSESSDTPSTGSGGGISVSRAGLRAAIGRGIRTVTGVINRVASSSQLEQEMEVWKADQEDVDDISDPAARVIWRRVPAEARTGDMIDLVVLGLAVLGYVAKSLDQRAMVRQMQQATDSALAAQATPAGDAGAPWPSSP